MIVVKINAVSSAVGIVMLFTFSLILLSLPPETFALSNKANNSSLLKSPPWV